MRKTLVALSVCLLFTLKVYCQEEITIKSFKPFTTHFTLNEEHQIEGKARNFILEKIGENQFVGLAEVHQSQQLSFFTVGFLELLKEKGFDHFALEVGPFSAQIVEELSSNPTLTTANLKSLNKEYGKNSFPKIPIVFVDKIEDALFIARASELEFNFWGLDQEFSYSYEMHFDRIYELSKEKTIEQKQAYEESIKLIRKNIFRKKISGETKNCWFMKEPAFERFFLSFKGNKAAEAYIDALRKSWDIYCRNETGKPSNQIRADYMKDNFDSLYNLHSLNNNLPKVFIKMGGVHLTRGISIFRVNDIGQHLTMKANENETGYLSIRHLSRYRNGKDLTGKKGWKGIELLMCLGKKEEWTLVDLRPIRTMLKNGELKADKKITFEIHSYDLLLIPPDDKKSKLNYRSR